MARIYTRTGDGGETSLGDGSRVPKSGPRVDLYGEVDELNSLLGVCVAILDRARGQGDDSGVLSVELAGIQSRLFDLGTVLANPVQSAAADDPAVDFGAEELERYIDGHAAGLKPLNTFILPGGCEMAAHLHVARTVCRRCERKAVALAAEAPLPAAALVFLNRLGDYLFTAARAANAAAGYADVPWRSAAGPD